MEAPNPRIALVTGSSRGLGRHIAARLARDGFAVALNGSDERRAQSAAQAIRDEGGTAEAFPADVTDEDAVEGLVEDIHSRFGPIDTVVFNATGPQPEGKIDDVGWDEHLLQLSFFVESPILIGHAVLPGMREARFGRLIFIDSEVVDVPPPGRSAYVTAKAAQVGLARAWARELAQEGITVNMVAPGFIPVERHADVPTATIDAYIASVLLGRIGVPDDVGGAVSYFASADAGFVTGQRLVVDGGRGLKTAGMPGEQ